MLARGPAGEWVAYFTATKVAATGLPATGTDADNIHGTLCTRDGTSSKCEPRPHTVHRLLPSVHC